MANKATPLYQLNEREQEILRRLSTGLSDQQIADELSLSLNTVKWYNRQIFYKLGVRNRTQAVAQARALGLIDADATPASPFFQANEQPSTLNRREAEQRIRFCTSSDGVRIAYATSGSGPPLVKAANWLSHLEFDWNSPVWRHWLSALSNHHTLVRYDQRGCGLSDWDVDDFSLDGMVRDLEAVVDTLGLEKFPLLGLSRGGTIGIAYAVRHPERVTHLILYGSYVRGRYTRALTEQQRQEANALIALMETWWGRDNPAFRQMFTTLFVPEATPEQARWFNDLQRVSTSPENAARISAASYSFDVTDLATQVSVPTLVLHGREDAVVPFDEGRQLATLIPNAWFVPLESKNHILLEHEPGWQKFVAAFRTFLS